MRVSILEFQTDDHLHVEVRGLLGEGCPAELAVHSPDHMRWLLSAEGVTHAFEVLRFQGLSYIQGGVMSFRFQVRTINILLVSRLRASF